MSWWAVPARLLRSLRSLQVVPDPDSLVNRLERLDALHRRGAIDANEYSRAKGALIDAMEDSSDSDSDSDSDSSTSSESDEPTTFRLVSSGELLRSIKEETAPYVIDIADSYRSGPPAAVYRIRSVAEDCEG